MIQEAKRDAEVDRVGRVFGDYIKESPYLDWMWSDKLGYILMQISFEGQEIVECHVIREAARLCWILFHEIADDAGLILHVFYARDIRINHQGIVGVVHYKSWLCSIRFFDMLLLYIINLHLVAATVSGIEGGQTSCFLKRPVRKFISAGLYDYMGAGSAFGVEPPVISASKGKGQFVILQIILSHIHMITVAGNIVHGPAGNLYFFPGRFPADVPALYQFFLNLHKVGFAHGNIQ